MDDFTFIKWMDEMLDPVKVRREEAFTSQRHREMLDQHEINNLCHEWELNLTRGLDRKLADLDEWWRDREHIEKLRKQEAETVRVKKAAKAIVFSDRQLEIARLAFETGN